MTQTVQTVTGALAASQGTLYTAPTGTIAHVTTISLVNTDASSRTATLWIKEDAGATERMITFVTLQAKTSQYENDYRTNDVFVLKAGASVTGMASVAGVVDYVLCIMETQ